LDHDLSPALGGIAVSTDSMRRSACLGIAALLSLLTACAGTPPVVHEQAAALQSRLVTSAHAPVNGIQMYYETYGTNEGIPLVVLHGGGSTIETTFGKLIPSFSARRRVIAIEEQGHGRTSDRTAAFRFETSAEDVASLLTYLKIERADLFGFSNGASVALQVAIHHPQLVRKLIFASSMTKRSGANPEFWKSLQHATFAGMPQPLKDGFLKVNPSPQNLRTMHDKDLERMRNFTDVRDEDIKSIQATTLIVLADRDVPTPEHGLELARMIPGARLMILPGGHGDYLGEAVAYRNESRSPALTAGWVEDFLDSGSRTAASVVKESGSQK
jgi:pimeloyl-ACP methyl ester carboxylesterase